MFFNKYILLSVVGILLNACGGIEPQKDHVLSPLQVLEQANEEQSFRTVAAANVETTSGISLREAYLSLVHPVLKKNCSSCHIHTDDGAHPFAGSKEDVAVVAAQRLIGSKLGESRFYLKVSNEHVPHPTKDIANAALPELTKALESFFAAVAANGDADGIMTADLVLASGAAEYPRINPSGFLIFEAEGGTVKPNTKLKVSLGVNSNGRAVSSGITPNHPVSGLARTYNAITYSGVGCQNVSYRIDQPAHVRGDSGENGLGIAKYIIPIDGVVRGTNGADLSLRGDTVTQQSIIRILPLNRIPAHNSGTDSPDEDYKSNFVPDFTTSCTFNSGSSCISGTPGSNYIVTVGNVAFNEDQINHLIAMLQNRRNQVNGGTRTRMYDEFLYGVQADAGDNGIMGEINSNPAAVFKYLRLTSGNNITGQQEIRLSHWNPSSNSARFLYNNNTLARGGRAEQGGSDYRTGTLHRNYTGVPLSWFTDEQKVPGVASFNFSVPSALSFADIEDPIVMPFRQYYRSSGTFRVRIKKESDGSFIPVSGTDTCPTFQSSDAWAHRANRINLERGESYTIEFLQTNQNTMIDAFILVADTELNEHLVANPNSNPTVLRQKFYGIGGDGVQEKTHYMNWDLDFGSFSMEVLVADGFYAFENPVFTMDAGHEGMNVSVKGFNFRINSNIALSDKLFNIDAVRFPRQNLSFGQVLIPKDKGFEKDKIGLVFARLEPTMEGGTLSNYEDGPPLEGLSCMRPDLFNELLWPVYSQQRIVLRNEYNDWKNDPYPARYTPGTEDDDPEVDFPDTPTVYTCTSCHNTEHPYLQLNASDYLVSCDLIIARTNLARPELSFSLRGLRGQFNHLPMYTMYDPWNGANLRKQTLSNGNVMIYGPMNGALGTYSKNDIEGLFGGNTTNAQKDNLYRRMALPRPIGFSPDSDLGLPIYQNGSFLTDMMDADDARYTNGDLSTWYKNTSADNMLDQHNETIRKWIENGFLKWVEAEKAARK